MGEKTIVCRHPEMVDRHGKGVCRNCGQVRQYDLLSPSKPPILIKRGMINGIPTEVIPGGGKYCEVEMPMKEKPFERTPENWPTMKRLEKHAWIVQHRKAITEDLEAIGQTATAEKWHLPQGTVSRLALRWSIKCKVIPRRRHKKVESIHVPIAQEETLRPTEDKTPDNWKEMTKAEKTKWLLEHRELITMDLETIGIPTTAQKWCLSTSSLYSLARQWNVEPMRTQPRKRTTTSEPLPPFPAFNEEWTEAVKVAWFGAYARVCCKKEKR